MQDGYDAQTNEMKRVICAVAAEFYAQAAPAAADRLARLHRAAWEEVVAGRSAVSAFAELRRQADRLFNADDLIDTCNRHMVWALTPVVGANMACGPGEDFVNLREVGAALSRLLTVALAGRGSAGPAERRAA